jgi:hypothetical protein
MNSDHVPRSHIFDKSVAERIAAGEVVETLKPPQRHAPKWNHFAFRQPTAPEKRACAAVGGVCSCRPNCHIRNKVETAMSSSTSSQ